MASLSTRLSEVADLYELGEALQTIIGRADRETLARKAVYKCDPVRVATYKDNIMDYIRDHDKGEVALTNLSGILFYILSKRPSITLQELKNDCVSLDNVKDADVTHILQSCKLRVPNAPVNQGAGRQDEHTYESVTD